MAEASQFLVSAIEAGNDGAHAGELDSFYLIERSGEEGRLWVKSYRRSKIVQLESVIDRALVSLRGRNNRNGWRLLSEAEAELGSLQDEAKSIVNVLKHRYFGVLAYAYYCQDNFPSSSRFVEAAEGSLNQALDGEAFLVPLAARFLDFGFQRIRINRNQNLWREMKQGVERVREMIRSQFPLCVLSAGSPILLSDIVEFFESIELSAEERRFLANFFDEDTCLKGFERAIAKIYALSGPLIPYP